MSSIVTPLGRDWGVGGAWWGASACGDPALLVPIEVGYWIWTWGCDWPGFPPISCWPAVSTFIWGAHNRWGEVDCCCICCSCFGGEEELLTWGRALSVVAAAAIGVVSGRGGTDGVAVTTGTIGMTAMGTWGGSEGGGGWWGCWWSPSSPQVMWLALTGWDSEVTSSTRFASASLLMRSFSFRCSSSAKREKKMQNEVIGLCIKRRLVLEWCKMQS